MPFEINRPLNAALSGDIAAYVAQADSVEPTTIIEADHVSKIAVGITEQGLGVLRGADDIAINGIDTWLGGVHLTGENLWRWDPQSAAIVRG